jgi:hypothetical protein
MDFETVLCFLGCRSSPMPLATLVSPTAWLRMWEWSGPESKAYPGAVWVNKNATRIIALMSLIVIV